MIPLLVVALQGALGFAATRRLTAHLPFGQRAALAFLAGLPLSSMLVVAVDLSPIALGRGSVLGLLAGVAGLGIAHTIAADPPRGWFRWRPRLHLIDIPFLVIAACLLMLSVWQRARFPILARDMIVGPDLVAKYAAAEGVIHSSVFTGPHLTGTLSNQPFYAPFTMLMQTLFRLAGDPFGTMWLSVVVLAFVAFVYGRLRRHLSGITAGVLLLFFLHAPLMYTYTSVVLTDYANAAFLALGALFSADYVRRRRRADLVLSATFVAAAAWTRSETILFVPGGVLILLLGSRGVPWSRRVSDGLVFALPAATLVCFWHLIYVGFILPASPGLGLDPRLVTAAGVMDTLKEIGTLSLDVDRYGYTLPLFGLVLVMSLVVHRSVRGWPLAGWVIVMFIGFWAIVILFPAASVSYTIKRGMFKLLPVALFYLAESPPVHWIDARQRSAFAGG